MARKMIVSDYDGTFNSDLRNLKLNIEAIKKFREEGNLFTISTGRSYNSIKNECDKYGIEYDFLNCFDGSVIFDSNDKLLFADYLTQSDLVSLAITLPHESSIIDTSYQTINGTISFDRYDIGKKELPEIVAIYLRLKLFRTIKHYAAGFENYPNISFNQVYNSVFIKNEFTKKDGLKKLEEYLASEISHDDIITIGDNINDLDMLKEYNGYKMLSSYPCLYGKGLKTTTEVHRLIKKINR